MHNSTAFLLITGSAPGIPVHTGQVLAFGLAPNSFLHEQNTFVFVFNNTIIANVSYHKLNMAYEKSYGTLVRIADRIEQTEGADECDSILVIGALENSEAYSANLSLDMTGTTDGFILRADDEIVGQSVLCSALNDYCAKNYSYVSGEEKTALLERIEEGTMGVWPDANSILVIDNVIVISLGEEIQ